MLALGAGCLDRAGVADSVPAAIDGHLLAVLGGFPPERMVLRAAVLVPFGVVGEIRLREELRSPRSLVGQRQGGRMPASSMATMFSPVPYVASPVTW